jgi:hypothetical protein
MDNDTSVGTTPDRSVLTYEANGASPVSLSLECNGDPDYVHIEFELLKAVCR